MKINSLISTFLVFIFSWGLNLKYAHASNSNSYLRVNLDSLTSNSGNLLFDLKDGETLSLLVHTDGCYGSSAKLILFTKEKNTVVSRLYFNPDLRSNLISSRGPFDAKNGNMIATISMTQSDIDYFQKFLNSLHGLKDQGCSNITRYYLSSGRFTLQKLDGSCQWNGFEQLQKRLFNQ